MIELVNVCAGYDRKEILHRIHLKLEVGKVTVLVGPNGCGKSTLLKTLVRILPCTSGEILIDGVNLKNIKTRQLAQKVAYLPQSRRIADISVLRLVLHGRFSHLTYPRKYRKEDIEIARKALEWADMADKEEENVSCLSGGMQQKAYIAMALAQDADTILMDEPTTYLDIVHQIRLMEMAKRMAREGKAVVMVLHDLSQALRVADRVVVMEEGYIRAHGTPEEVYAEKSLEKVFGVQIERVAGKKGWHYLLE